MAQLEAGMFREGSAAAKQFGITDGQVCARPVIRNAGWFCQTGARIGSGDLCADSLHRIKANLEAGQLFVIVPEWSWKNEDDGEVADDLDADGLASAAELIVTAEELFAANSPAGHRTTIELCDHRDRFGLCLQGQEPEETYLFVRRLFSAVAVAKVV